MAVDPIARRWESGEAHCIQAFFCLIITALVTKILLNIDPSLPSNDHSTNLITFAAVVAVIAGMILLIRYTLSIYSQEPELTVIYSKSVEDRRVRSAIDSWIGDKWNDLTSSTPYPQAAMSQTHQND